MWSFKEFLYISKQRESTYEFSNINARERGRERNFPYFEQGNVLLISSFALVLMT